MLFKLIKTDAQYYTRTADFPRKLCDYIMTADELHRFLYGNFHVPEGISYWCSYDSAFNYINVHYKIISEDHVVTEILPATAADEHICSIYHLGANI